MSDFQKIGALWVHESKNGNRFMSGTVMVTIPGSATRIETDITIWKNNYKESDKHPDYVIYLSQPDEATAETDTLPF